jgi:hypothetical protein
MGIGLQTGPKTSYENRENELEDKRKNLLMFSSEGIEAEIKVWELIKSCNYSDKSFLFKRNINVDNVLKELYKAKEQKKVVELETKSLFVNYWTEEEIKKYVEKKILEHEKMQKVEEFLKSINENK